MHELTLFFFTSPAAVLDTGRPFFMGGTMSWYYQYRYAEITSPEYQNSFVSNKAFPITKMKITDNKIKNVELQLSSKPPIHEWFNWKEVTLYKGTSEWAKLGEKKRDINIFKKLTKYLSA